MSLRLPAKVEGPMSRRVPHFFGENGAKIITQSSLLKLGTPKKRYQIILPKEKIGMIAFWSFVFYNGMV